jgi:hypothetical protein
MKNKIVPFHSQQDIEAAADQYLNSFNGGNDEFSDFSGGSEDLLGFDDDFLEFDGSASSFANEVATGRRFTITIDNTQGGGAQALLDSTDKPIILIPSFDPQGGVVVVDGTNNVSSVPGNASLNQQVIITGIPEKLAALQAWIKLNPVRCLGLKLESTNILQMGKFLTIAPRSPFRKLESENIYIQDYKTENQYNDKVATIMRPFQMDGQTDLLLNVSKNSITTVTFYFGAALNTAKALRKKANLANGVLGVQHRL